jgi:UDP-N-acetylmuramoylalanine--D-glutamate ligase
MQQVYTFKMNIAIWGLGISGMSALRLLSTSSHQLSAINSGAIDTWKNLEEVTSLIGLENCFEENDLILERDIDQIIIAPGVDRKSKLIKFFIDKGIEVISEIELAARSLEIPIVAITGTNGKTTTATMIAIALEEAGKRVFLGGNIGIPFCDIFSNEGDEFDIVVLELSSFQLESLRKFKANMAIILNINESHMERYDSFEQYKNAKLNIVMNQTSSDLLLAPKELSSLETKASFEPLVEYDCPGLKNSKLKGEHYKKNLYCVKSVLSFFEIKNTEEVIARLLKVFHGVKYRLQWVGSQDNIDFYNDSKSTNIFSTISAIKSFSNHKVCLILGGKLRDDKTDISNSLASLEIEKVICFGEASELIYTQLNGLFDVTKIENLENLKENLDEDNKCDIVLFSPGFPSFDKYKNYLERGEHFDSIIKKF